MKLLERIVICVWYVVTFTPFLLVGWLLGAAIGGFSVGYRKATSLADDLDSDTPRRRRTERSVQVRIGGFEYTKGA